jgi:hypothetical protein
LEFCVILYFSVHLQSYLLRNGVVHVMGQLLCNGLAGDADKSSRDSLLQILLDRFHDVNSYTRNQVLKTWILLAWYVESGGGGFVIFIA